MNKSDKKVILFGELHGTREIPLRVTDFLFSLDYQHVTLALEISSKYQPLFDEAFAKNNLPLLHSIFQSAEPDGRITLELYTLLEKILQYNKTHGHCIDILCIDIDKNTQEHRDTYMAKKILRSTSNVIIGLIGSVHAAKIPVEIEKHKIIPAGYLIKKELGSNCTCKGFSVLSGTYLNNAKKTINEPIHLEEKYFDEIIIIEKVSAAQFLKK